MLPDNIKFILPKAKQLVPMTRLRTINSTQILGQFYKHSMPILVSRSSYRMNGFTLILQQCGILFLHARSRYLIFLFVSLVSLRLECRSIAGLC